MTQSLPNHTLVAQPQRPALYSPVLPRTSCPGYGSPGESPVLPRTSRPGYGSPGESPVLPRTSRPGNNQLSAQPESHPGNVHTPRNRASANHHTPERPWPTATPPHNKEETAALEEPSPNHLQASKLGYRSPQRSNPEHRHTRQSSNATHHVSPDIYSRTRPVSSVLQSSHGAIHRESRST